MSDTIQLVCEGFSDDTFSVEGPAISESHDNCASGKPIAFKISVSATDGLFVVGQYGKRSAGWSVAVEPIDEDFPDWPMRIERGERGYSPRLVIDAPTGVKVERAKRAKAETP